MNKSEFLSSLRGWTGFSDPATQSDDLLLSWVRMGEERISSDLRCRDMITIKPLFASDGEMVLPANFREASFVRTVDTNLVLEYKALPDFFNLEKPAGYFTTSGFTMFIGGNYDGEVDLHYFGDVPPLVNNATWLSTRYLSIYTAAVMCYATLGMQEEDGEVSKWNAIAQGRIDKVTSEYTISRTAGSRLRRKPTGSFG